MSLWNIVWYKFMKYDIIWVYEIWGEIIKYDTIWVYEIWYNKSLWNMI